MRQFFVTMTTIFSMTSIADEASRFEHYQEESFKLVTRLWGGGELAAREECLSRKPVVDGRFFIGHISCEYHNGFEPEEYCDYTLKFDTQSRSYGDHVEIKLTCDFY